MFTSIMPNFVPLWGVWCYIFDNQIFICEFSVGKRKNSSQNDRDFIRMKFIRLSDIINIFAVQKYSGDVFKNRSTQSRK